MAAIDDMMAAMHPGDGAAPPPETGGSDLDAACADMLAAFEAKDAAALATAFQAAFLACEAEPHEEAGEKE